MFANKRMMARPAIPMIMYELRLSPERSTADEESPATAPLTEWEVSELSELSELVEFECDDTKLATRCALRLG